MKPKKHLGQNFLKDKAVLDKIIQVANLNADDLVIEVGSGKGVLTKELVKHAGKVIAIEIDENLTNQLKIKYRNNKKIEIINEDILKINLPELISQKFVDSNLFVDSHRFSYNVIANIPYYITSPIIQLFLETRFPPKEMILMVQKEVAERICSKPGQMSILAVSVQYYAKPELLFYVPKAAFWPMPEVDSAVIHITCNLPTGQAGMKHVTKSDARNFFRIVKAGFCAKRKLLINNLSSSFYLDKKEVEEKIKKAGINPNSRAQELSVKDWKNIANELNTNF